MNVAEEILADMALDDAIGDPPVCHFTRLPLELRKRFYALLLLSPPVARIHCTPTAHTKQCSPGSRFLASTCKPKATNIRTICCGTCEWRGGDVHTAIMSTNQAIYEEAAEVLYEHCQILFMGNLSHLTTMSAKIFQIHRIRRIVLVLSSGLGLSALSRLRGIPDLRIVELHFDVDLTSRNYYEPNAKEFEELGILNEYVEWIVDVHITCAWDDPDGGWGEPVSRREDVSVARASALDKLAAQMRQRFVDELSEIFTAAGKTLRLRDN